MCPRSPYQFLVRAPCFFFVDLRKKLSSSTPSFRYVVLDMYKQIKPFNSNWPRCYTKLLISCLAKKQTNKQNKSKQKQVHLNSYKLSVSYQMGTKLHTRPNIKPNREKSIIWNSLFLSFLVFQSLVYGCSHNK